MIHDTILQVYDIFYTCVACRKMKASSSTKPNRPHLLGDTSARPTSSGGRPRRRGESSSNGNSANYNSSSNTNNSTPVTAAKRCTMPPSVGERAAELLQQQLGRPFSDPAASRLPKSDSMDSASVSYTTILNPLSGSGADASSGERLERLAQMATPVQSLPLGVGSVPMSPHSPLVNGESTRNSGVSLQLERRSSDNSSDAPTPRAGTTDDSSSTGGNPIAPLYPVGGIDPPHASPTISPALSHHSINGQAQHPQAQQSGAHNAHALRIAIPEDTYCECDPMQTSLEVPALQPSQFGKLSLSPYTFGVVNASNFRSRCTSDTFHLRRPPTTIALRIGTAVPDDQEAESLAAYHRDPPNPIPVPSATSSGAPTPHLTRGIAPSSTFLRPSHEALIAGNAGPPLSLFDPSTRLPLANHLAAAANDRYSSAHSTNSSRSNLSSSFTSGISESGGYGVHCKTN